jgi:hypothetical protein
MLSALCDTSAQKRLLLSALWSKQVIRACAVQTTCPALLYTLQRTHAACMRSRQALLPIALTATYTDGYIEGSHEGSQRLPLGGCCSARLAALLLLLPL